MSRNPLNIFILARSLDVGGTERQLTLLAPGLAARGHRVILALLYSGGALQARMDGTGVQVVSLGKSGRWDIVGPLRRLRRLLADEQPDVIYSFLPMQNVLAALLRPSSVRAPLVFGVRASGMQLEYYDRLSALSYRAEAWLSRRADMIVANASHFLTGAAARGYPVERISIVPNGIDTDTMRIDPEARRRVRRAWNVGEETFVIGMVARLDPMKDHSNFLAAAAAHAKHDRAARFICVGGGGTMDYRGQLQQLAHELGIADRVSFLGQTEDVVGAYNAFDIGTLSSAFGEGFPNAIGEAMACGLPVVATDVGDAREIIAGYGIVVPPRRPDLLSAAWTQMRERLNVERDLRQSTRDHIVRNFGVDVMVERTERILAQLCAAQSSMR